MNKPATSVRPRATAETPAADSAGTNLVCAFNALRNELVSTLWFILGHQEDAQDAAQEAFLRWWRTRETLPAVLNLRAWIFRVGLNVAKDLRRSAWRRKVKPLNGADAMP